MISVHYAAHAALGKDCNLIVVEDSRYVYLTPADQSKWMGRPEDKERLLRT